MALECGAYSKTTWLCDMLKQGFEPIPGYRLEQFLGRGQFGEVWRASSPGGTQVALKFLNVRERQGRKEFRAIQKVKGIRHPHLVQTYALWLLDENNQVIDDAAFESDQSIMMETVRGTMVYQPSVEVSQKKPSMLVIATVLCDQNLMERMRDCQKKGSSGIPVPELLGYVEDAAKAIDFLNAPRHEMGDGPVAIHHCDIKPENIMIVGDLAVVGDFGVARILRSGGSESRSTTMGGSVAYAPPETFDNRTESSSDQYSLAITYFELRTGKLPFPEDSAAQVMRDKIAGALNFSEVTPAEAKVLMRATSVDPAKRFPTARAFVESLQQAFSVTPKRKASLGWLGGAIIGTAASVLITIAVLINGNPTEPIEKPTPPPDWAALYQEAKSEFVGAAGNTDLRNKAIGKAVRSIKEGDIQPKILERIGIDPPSEPNPDDSDEDRALQRFSVRSPIQTVVKASGDLLSFISLQDNQIKHAKVDGMGVIDQVIWLENELVMLDVEKKLFRIPGLVEIPSEESLSAIPIEMTSERPAGNAWLRMSPSGNLKKLFLIDGEKEKKSTAKASGLGALKRSELTLSIFDYNGVDELKPIVFDRSLVWKSPLSIAKPKLTADHEGRFFLIACTDDNSLAVHILYDTVEQESFELNGTALFRSLKELKDLTFVDGNGTFVFVGTSLDEDQETLGWCWRGNDGWEVQLIERENTDPIVGLHSNAQGCFVATLTTGFLEGQQSEPKGPWQLLRYPKFEDALMASVTDSTDTINAICGLDADWNLVGTRGGRLLLRFRDEPPSESSFEISQPFNDTIKAIRQVGNRIVVVTQEVAIVWFDVDEILFTAKVSRGAGVKPIAPTLSPTVGS